MIGEFDRFLVDDGAPDAEVFKLNALSAYCTSPMYGRAFSALPYFIAASASLGARSSCRQVPDLRRGKGGGTAGL